MYREIIKPTSEEYMIKIPKEYLDQEVEILVFPLSLKNRRDNNKKNLDRLFNIGVWDISEEDAKVKDWKIEEF